jgi:hypothetical protein
MELSMRANLDLANLDLANLDLAKARRKRSWARWLERTVRVGVE